MPNLQPCDDLTLYPTLSVRTEMHDASKLQLLCDPHIDATQRSASCLTNEKTILHVNVVLNDHLGIRP